MASLPKKNRLGSDNKVVVLFVRPLNPVEQGGRLTTITRPVKYEGFSVIAVTSTSGLLKVGLPPIKRRCVSTLADFVFRQSELHEWLLCRRRTKWQYWDRLEPI